MPKKIGEPSVRVTASLTCEQGRVLRTLAERSKISVAWLIRYAVSQLVENADGIQVSLGLNGTR